MLAKEKAGELFNKFYRTYYHTNSVKIRSDIAIESAITCVDEIIEALNQNFCITDYLHFYETKTFEWYTDVKKELRKL